jgi:hypothetical protein
MHTRSRFIQRFSTIVMNNDDPHNGNDPDRDCGGIRLPKESRAKCQK